jgi:hypothetical protein
MQVQRNSSAPILNFIVAHRAQETQAKAATNALRVNLGHRNTKPEHATDTFSSTQPTTTRRKPQADGAARPSLLSLDGCLIAPSGAEATACPTTPSKQRHSTPSCQRSAVVHLALQKERSGPGVRTTGQKAGTGAEARPRAHNRIQKGRICSCSKCTTKTVHGSQPTWPRPGSHPTSGNMLH